MKHVSGFWRWLSGLPQFWEDMLVRAVAVLVLYAVLLGVSAVLAGMEPASGAAMGLDFMRAVLLMVIGGLLWDAATSYEAYKRSQRRTGTRHGR